MIYAFINGHVCVDSEGGAGEARELVHCGHVGVATFFFLSRSRHKCSTLSTITMSAYHLPRFPGHRIFAQLVIQKVRSSVTDTATITSPSLPPRLFFLTCLEAHLQSTYLPILSTSLHHVPLHYTAPSHRTSSRLPPTPHITHALKRLYLFVQ